MDGHERTDGVPLTPQEREALQTALSRGYFETPRRISTVTLADELGVSDRKFTELLRRGMAKVLRHNHWGEHPVDERLWRS